MLFQFFYLSFSGSNMADELLILESNRIAALRSNFKVEKIFVARNSYQLGDIYIGCVDKIMPTLDASFIDLGISDLKGFIHREDLGPLKLNKFANDITKLLKPRQKVLVQVTKEPTSTKGPRLTGNISLSGRFLILLPFGTGISICSTLTDSGERFRLRTVLQNFLPKNMGILVRQQAYGIRDFVLFNELIFLQKQWRLIEKKAQYISYPQLISHDSNFVQRVLRDLYTVKISRIFTDSPKVIRQIKIFLAAWSIPFLPNTIVLNSFSKNDFYKKNFSNIYSLSFFSLNKLLKHALNPKVFLPSGGSIIIQPTEAFTVIDVNSGSFFRGRNLRSSTLQINFEAAKEIAFQIRLRNLAGAIVIDFIDMQIPSDQNRLLQYLAFCLSKDESNPQIIQMSELGFVEITRRREGKNLYELFSPSCRICQGFGSFIPNYPMLTADGRR